MQVVLELTSMPFLFQVWLHREVVVGGIARRVAQPATDDARSRRRQRRPGGKRVRLELRKGEFLGLIR